MWIITTFGFFSVVEKHDDKARGTLTIRARVRSDLENLRDRYLPDMGEIIESTRTDYRYRAVAKREAVSAAMSKLTDQIDYDNFKNEVAIRQGYSRAAVYGDVWGALYRLQQSHLTSPLFGD